MSVVNSDRGFNSPTFWRRFHLAILVLALLQVPLVYWWQRSLQGSVAYLVGLTLFGAIVAQVSAWQGARLEVRQQKRG